MDDKLAKVACDGTMIKLIIEAKKEPLTKVAKQYEIDMEELEDVLHDVIKEAEIRVGVGNTAVDFLIVDSEQRGKGYGYENIEKDLKESIQKALIYFVNVEGRHDWV